MLCRNKYNTVQAGLLCGLLAASLTGGTAFPAFAGSPEFAYSAEKWAALRDDNLEFDEIADLIHEYNNTVIQNQISYRDELDKTSSDLAQDYYDAANDIYSNIEYPDSDDSNYGSRIAAALNNEIQAEQLLERGDKTTDDSETLKIGYDQTEASLVKQAQQLMINYWSQRYSLETLREQKSRAEASLQSQETRLSAGLSTRAQVLSAREAVSSAEASILSAESNLATTKENLCLMLGWTYGAEVAIGELPEPDLEAIGSIDVAADITTALANNYALKKTTKQLSNARSSSVKETLTQTEKNQKETISNSVKSSYEALILARSNYQQAQEAFALQQVSLDTAGRKLQAGTITQNAYETQQASYLAAEVSVRTRKLSLLQAMLNYDWCINGLAAAS